MKKLYSLFLILIAFSGVFLNAQSTPETALQKFSQDFPQEKFHILLNKKSFVAGENIYFKCFVIDGFKPSTISTSLFVELFDVNKKLITRKLVPVIQGEASGNLFITENTTENIYFLRFYTPWSTNFSETFQGMKMVPIYNPKSAQKLVLNKNKNWNITIHPEGGSLIQNIHSRIAVRMHSDTELPVKWSGYLVNTQNPSTKIVQFTAMDENVAVFNLLPESGQNYKLFIKDEQGQEKEFTMPMINSSGISLEVNSENGMITYTPKFNELERKSAYYKVLGQINSTPVYNAKFTALKSGTALKIPTQTLVNGILQLVIFDDQNRIVADRLVFVDPQNLRYGKVNLNDAVLNLKEKTPNVIQLKTNNQYTNFTASVTDGITESTEDEHSLLSTLWLTGDLASRISFPAQYFRSSGNPVALDALLMTEKWERFSWQKIISGQFPLISNPSFPYISYSGKANINGNPAIERVINFIFTTKDLGAQQHQVKTDENGMFMFSEMIFDEPFDIMYQLDETAKDKSEKLTVYFQPLVLPNNFRSSLPSTAYILTNDSNAEQPVEIKRATEDLSFSEAYSGKTAEIEAVNITAKKKDLTQKLNKKLTGPGFRGLNESVYDFVNEESPHSRDVFTFLDSRVAGLNVQRTGGKSTITIRGVTAKFYINEFSADEGEVQMLNINDIAMIKVMKSPFRGLDGGAVVIYLRNGGSGTQQKWKAGSSLPSLGFKNFSGYDKSEAFAIVDYSTVANFSAQDQRLTLFWSPAIQADKMEAGVVNFYNNSVAKSYNITIIGYDQNDGSYLYLNQKITP